MVLFRAGDIVWHLTTPFAWPAILHKKQASAAFYKFTYFEDGQTWEQVKHPVDELKPFWGISWLTYCRSLKVREKQQFHVHLRHATKIYLSTCMITM